ncbi:hypothetical protein V5F53_05655 [Xanthobacter sp. V4C-4]|uniref:hypothetical protein n=1 Tax=Xanthobacter cornucopiae TaxID=3119924 RepID=UPI0037276777
MTRGRNLKPGAVPVGEQERRRRLRDSANAAARGGQVIPLPRRAGPDDGVVLTPEQQRRRRARSVAIALVLGALALLFYAVTIVKLGPGVLSRPL